MSNQSANHIQHPFYIEKKSHRKETVMFIITSYTSVKSSLKIYIIIVKVNIFTPQIGVLLCYVAIIDKVCENVAIARRDIQRWCFLCQSIKYNCRTRRL